MIRREPTTRECLPIRIPGAVRLPNMSFWGSHESKGTRSTRSYGISFSWSARSTAAHGCEPGME